MNKDTAKHLREEFCSAPANVADRKQLLARALRTIITNSTLLQGGQEGSYGSRTSDEVFVPTVEYLYGKPGSAQFLANEMYFALCNFADCNSADESEWRDLSRQDMVKALASCDSDFFRSVTKIATALRERNAEFFRKLAAGLEQPDSFGAFGPLETEPIQCLRRAYMDWTLPAGQLFEWTLPAYEEDVASGAQPCKRQMKLLTQRFWAVSRLIKKEEIDFCFATEKQPQDVEDKIKYEVASLPKQNWTRLFKDAGLDHLPEGKAGRPRKKL